jgi:Rrf2 family protein
MAANSQFSMAVHVLTLLARAEGGNLKSDEIAASVNTNPVVIRRLLGQLAAAELVNSQTGASGGSRLATAAERIRLSEVYRAVCCGEVFALHGAPNRDCPVGAHIEAVLCRLQKEIDRSIDSKLAEYSLADVIREVAAV